MHNYEVNDLIVGTISEIRNYGAVITFDNGYSGFLHIKQVSENYISNLHTYLKQGADIKVKIIEKNNDDHFFRLSLKDVPYSERIIFSKPRKNVKINPGEVDFSPLREKLPQWIKEALEEINDD